MGTSEIVRSVLAMQACVNAWALALAVGVVFCVGMGLGSLVVLNHPPKDWT